LPLAWSTARKSTSTATLPGYTQSNLTPPAKPSQKNLEFCGDKNLWTRTVAATAELAAQYSYDDRHYAIIIAEDLGDADGLTLEFMRSAAIQNAAAGASVQPEDVTIFDSSDRLFDGFNASQIVYGIEMEGVNVVYSNVIVSKNTETFQLIVYAVGSTYTDTHQQIMDEFLAGIEVK